MNCMIVFLSIFQKQLILLQHVVSGVTIFIPLGANDDGKKELERVDDSLIDLKKHDDALRSFITLYKKRNSL